MASNTLLKGNSQIYPSYCNLTQLAPILAIRIVRIPVRFRATPSAVLSLLSPAALLFLRSRTPTKAAAIAGGRKRANPSPRLSVLFSVFPSLACSFRFVSFVQRNTASEKNHQQKRQQEEAKTNQGCLSYAANESDELLVCLNSAGSVLRSCSVSRFMPAVYTQEAFFACSSVGGRNRATGNRE